MKIQVTLSRMASKGIYKTKFITFVSGDVKLQYLEEQFI